jgi:hypothetical protein
MNAATPGTPLRHKPMLTPYVILWAALGALSVGCLSVLLIAPDWLEDLKPAPRFADPQSNQGQRAAARLAANVDRLNDSLAQLQLDMAKVKTDVAAQSEQGRTIAAQVTAIEQKLGGAAAATAVEAAIPPQATPQLLPAAIATGDPLPPAASTPVSVAAPAAPVTTAAEPASDPGTAQQPKLINADTEITTKGFETGSVDIPPAAAVPAATANADAISFGPAIVKPAPKPVGLRLSSAPDIDSLRLSWSLLAEKHGDTLKEMQPRVTASGNASNPSFDLIAGPVKSRAEAAKLCKALAAQNVPCKVGTFTGDTL